MVFSSLAIRDKQQVAGPSAAAAGVQAGANCKIKRTTVQCTLMQNPVVPIYKAFGSCYSPKGAMESDA